MSDRQESHALRVGWVAAGLFVALAAPPAWSTAPAIEVALTVDDVPAAGDELPGVARSAVAEQFIETLRKHHLAGVYGFLNGVLAQDMADRLRALDLWKQAGFRLGNHTFSHRDLSVVSAGEFIADLERNESMLLDYAANIAELKVLRYPFLHEGETLAKRAVVRSYLARRGYRIAQVTIDANDWRFGPPYLRCVAARNAAGVAALDEAFLALATAQLAFNVELARRLYGRPVKHILLVHLGAATAHALDALLTAYEKRGVRFVSLDEAMADPIYAEDTADTGPPGEAFLLQAQRARKVVFPDLPGPKLPTAILEGACREGPKSP